MANAGRQWVCALLLLGLLGCAGGAAPVREASTGEPVREGSHLVRRGDTLWSIAFRYGWQLEALARRNGIKAPYIIHPGQRIRLDPGPARPRSRVQPQPAERGPAVPPVAAEPGSPPAPAAAVDGWRWPLAQGGSGSRRTRNGLDLPVTAAQPVRAAAAGTVVYAGDGLREYGNLVIVRHSGDYLSAYGRLQRIRVSEGKKVKAGAVLADTGPEGDGSAGALHFEIRHQGQPVDPRTLLP